MDAESPREKPLIRLDRIVTRQGDRGRTLGPHGTRLWKDEPLIHCLGEVDELNVCVGFARALALEGAARHRPLEAFAAVLLRIQHQLFNLGATIMGTRQDQWRVTEQMISELEAEIAACNSELEPLDSFVLPGGSRLSLQLQLCRAVCRRAERAAVTLWRAQQLPAVALAYLNRLGDAFFVWSRWANRIEGQAEIGWDPGASGSLPAS